MQRRWLILGLMALAFSSCQKHDNTDSGAVQPPAAQPNPPTPPPPAPGSLKLEIYTDDLHQGGAYLYPGGDNQVLDFKDASNPIVGSLSMRYFWNGGDTILPTNSHVFAGVDLMHVGGSGADLSLYNSTPGKDLTGKGYTRVTFDARGGLDPGVVLKIEVSDDGAGGRTPPCIVLSSSGVVNDSTSGNFAPPCTNLATLQGGWQSYSLPVTNADLVGVKDYFKATFIYKLPPGLGTSSGSTVYFDQILYQP